MTAHSVLFRERLTALRGHKVPAALLHLVGNTIAQSFPGVRVDTLPPWSMIFALEDYERLQ